MSQDIYPVKPHVRERAHLKSVEEYERQYRRSLDDPESVDELIEAAKR